MIPRPAFTGISATVLAMLAMLAGAAAASAAPVIRVSMLKPDYVTPGGNMAMWVNVLNVGDEPLAGNLTIKYTFPAGVTPVEPEADQSPSATCAPSGQVEECTIDATGVPLGRTLTYATLTSVDPSATGTLSGQVDVSGGGASNAVSVPLAFDTSPIGPFAIDSFNVGLLDNPAVQPAQAGSVPTEVDTAAELRSQAVSNFGVSFPGFVAVAPPESMRDVIVHVPAGFVGYPPSTPARCTASQLDEGLTNGGVSHAAQVPVCPRDSQIGLALVNGKDTVPVYNLVPPLGAPAEFAFVYQGLIVNLRAKLRPSDDGIDIVTSEAPSAIPISKFEVQLWGVPADSKYDLVRAECTAGLFGASGALCPSSAVRSSFLRLPTSCGGPLRWGIEINTYQHPETFQHQETTTPPVTGCERNPFDPSLSLVPSTLAPHAASGVDTTLTMPQEPVNGVLPADIRRVTVALPAGVALNPSSAGGLQACSDSDLKLGLEGPATCPDASKVATVLVRTPLLDHPIGGSVFLRTQNSSDPQSGEMFRLAIEIRSDDDGIAIRLPGTLSVDPGTGQLTATFDDLPQLPIDSMELHFKTGARAPLATPSVCGKYHSETDFLGWNGATVHDSSSSFLVSGCTAPQFEPALRAGVANPMAGASSPFGVKLTRDDADEQFGSIASVVLPPGLTGNIASVPVRCTDAQAAAAACPTESRIGNVTVGAGVGSDPFYITDGNAYLTGPYKGAPFGLAFVVHAEAGPFDLGDVVVRGAIAVDPHTAQAIVQTDPLPTILKGVPLQLRDIRTNIDRPGFMLNPTSCEPMQVAATVTSTQGASATLSNRFQVGECEKLAFKPSFAAVTNAKTSRRGGASLHVVVKSAAGQANIRRVHVVVPKALPARLATLNHACAEAVFAANPAACPAESVVGTATAHTPILPAPMTGPAIFVSHGGAKFPDLDVVLQGEGVTVILTGNTYISKAGYTSSTFASVPDLPVSRFDLVLPQGPHSVLAANGDLCSAGLVMPTTITGQNGARVVQNTRIAVTGCRPTVRVVGHSVKGARATIRVSVPSAGRLTATGKGIVRSVKHITKAGTVTIGVRLTRRDLEVLARNPHQRVDANVRLRFTPRQGAPLSATVRLLLG